MYKAVHQALSYVTVFSETNLTFNYGHKEAYWFGVILYSYKLWS